MARGSRMSASSGGRWSKSHEHRREGEWGMRASVVVMIAALVIGALVSSCATGGPPTPTAPACVFVDRCRNPALSTGGGA
jgi:hypothetical protein